MSDSVGKDLGASSRKRVEACRLQALQHLAIGQMRQAGDVCDFGRAERIQFQRWLDFLESAEKVFVEFDAVAWMEAALQKQLVSSQSLEFGDFRKVVVTRQRIGFFGFVGPTVKVAELAAGEADVGIVDVTVDLVADAAFRNVREPGGLRLLTEFLERGIAVERRFCPGVVSSAMLISSKKTGFTSPRFPFPEIR